MLRQLTLDGRVYYDWGLLKSVIRLKASDCMEAKNKAEAMVEIDGETFSMRKNRILDLLDSFEGAPFTIQRLIEILYDGPAMYKSTLKLINGIEKV